MSEQRKFIVLKCHYENHPLEEWISASKPFKTVREARDFIESMERAGNKKGELQIFKKID